MYEVWTNFGQWDQELVDEWYKLDLARKYLRHEVKYNTECSTVDIVFVNDDGNRILVESHVMV